MSIRTRALSIAGCCALSGVAALVITAPSAVADPAVPAPPPPLDDATIQVVAGDPAPPPPEPVQHLLSPENLPPGTTDVPVEPQGGLSYLRDIWHAMQTQDVTFSEALFLLAQRPLNPNAAPPPGLSAHPQPLPEPLPAEPPPAEPPPGPPANPLPLPAELLPPPPPPE